MATSSFWGAALSIEDLGNLGELIGSIALLISLIYVGIEIRKNTDTARTSTYQSIVSDFGSLNQTIISTPGMSALVVKAQEDFDSLSEDEKAQISQLFFFLYHSFENMYYQARKGYLEDDVWLGWKRLILTYHQRPGHRSWWNLRRHVFSESFANFLETEKLDVPVASYHDVVHKADS